jgi:hypothetical protein
MPYSTAYPFEAFDHLTSDEICARLNAIVAQLDPKHKDCRHSIENLRAFIHLMPQLTVANRLDLIFLLQGVAKNCRDLQRDELLG